MACHAKVKLLGYHERGVQLIKRQGVHAAIPINAVATTVTITTSVILTLLLLFLLLPQLL